jgi:hypothetical protein
LYEVDRSANKSIIKKKEEKVRLKNKKAKGEVREEKTARNHNDSKHRDSQRTHTSAYFFTAYGNKLQTCRLLVSNVSQFTAFLVNLPLLL